MIGPYRALRIETINWIKNTIALDPIACILDLASWILHYDRLNGPNGLNRLNGLNQTEEKTVAVNVTMPKWGLTMKEGRITRWFKSEGDAIQPGEPFFEVETEKITNTVEAETSGVVFQIVISAGETVAVGSIVAIIAQPDEQPQRVYAGPSAAAVSPAAAEKPHPTRETTPEKVLRDSHKGTKTRRGQAREATIVEVLRVFVPL